MIGRLKRRLRALLHRSAMEREMDEEMQYYLERQVEQNVRQGMSADEARSAALKSFGGIEQAKEACRDARGVRVLEETWQDLRYGARMLGKNPGFTAIAVLTLALGIGANTAIFSVVYAVLLRPLPFPESNELVVINDENGKTGETFPAASPADFLDWKSQSQSFKSLAAYSSGWSITLLEGDRPEVVPSALVTDEFFKTLRAQPLIGRAFTPEEFRGGFAGVVVLSHRFWQRRFGGDPNIVGKKLAVGPGNNITQGSITIVGVMPPDFKLPATAEAWIPLGEENGLYYLRASRIFQTVARLKPGVTLVQAEAEMRTIAARLASQYPESDANWSVRLASLRETLVGDVRLALLILLGAVSLVLLIACGNVASLLLARVTTRYKELAIRAAMGASRWRIVRQLITESLLLSVIGGALGVMMAQWCVSAIVWLIPKDLHFPRIEEARVDLAVLGFTITVALLAGIALGLIPGLKASRPDLQESLKESGRSATSGRRVQRMRGAMVVAEIALTLVLLAGAGLLIKSLLKLQRVELGFNQEKLLVVPVSASMSKYAQPELRAAFFERIAEQVQTVPGIRSVATASWPPLMYTIYFPFTIEGKTNPNEVPQAWYNAVSPNYFRLMGIRLREGREFTEHDRTGRPNAAVINETMRRHYFAGEDAVGKRLTINYLGTPTTFEVVGVVNDIKQEALSAPANAQIYVSYLQVPWFSTSLIIRTETEPDAVISSVERAIRSVDPVQSGSGAKTMDQLLSDSVAQPRFYSLLLGGFAALALLLAAIGIYGVISYAVAQRTHEIGIRIALGAQRLDVLKLVIGQGMILVLAGVGTGLGAAFALTRIMKSLLYEVGATDPVTFTGVVMLLAVVAWLACLVPARRATKVDPMVALRHE